MKARIKCGAPVGQDMGCHKWPIIENDVNVIFDVEDFNNEKKILTAKNYGDRVRENSYGNGNLFVAETDLIFVDDASEEIVEKSESQAEKALMLAYKMHAGQKRKFSGAPYIVHPIRVAGMFENNFMRTIALLHDVMEDCGVRKCDLEYHGFEDYVISNVEALTRDKKKETYNEYIQRIVDSGDVELIQLKLADAIDNLNDCPLTEHKMIDKFRKTILKLRMALK